MRKELPTEPQEIPLPRQTSNSRGFGAAVETSEPYIRNYIGSYLIGTSLHYADTRVNSFLKKYGDCGASTQANARGALFCVALGTEHADIGEVPVVVGVIQTVTDDKFVADFKAAHVGFVLAGVRAGLVQK